MQPQLFPFRFSWHYILNIHPKGFHQWILFSDLKNEYSNIKKKKNKKQIICIIGVHHFKHCQEL